MELCSLERGCGAGTPNGSRPAGIVFPPADYMYVQLRHHVSEGGDVDFVGTGIRAKGLGRDFDLGKRLFAVARGQIVQIA